MDIHTRPHSEDQAVPLHPLYTMYVILLLEPELCVVHAGQLCPLPVMYMQDGGAELSDVEVAGAAADGAHNAGYVAEAHTELVLVCKGW